MSGPVPHPDDLLDGSEGRPPTRERTVDLVALIALLGTGAGVYCMAGANAFNAVTGAATTLYALWRGTRNRGR